MSVISMKQLLEAGCHFGHQTRKWNPKMKKYIFTDRNDIHILNLEDTSKQVDAAYVFVKEKVLAGANVLFIGTKKQAVETVKQEAERSNMFYINSRWLGGTLTNFSTIRKRIDRMNKLNNMETLGDFDLLPKKEVIKLKAERDKLAANLIGIKDMTSLPGLIILVDPHTEHIAVKEAKKLVVSRTFSTPAYNNYGYNGYNGYSGYGGYGGYNGYNGYNQQSQKKDTDKPSSSNIVSISTAKEDKEESTIKYGKSGKRKGNRKKKDDKSRNAGTTPVNHSSAGGAWLGDDDQW